MLMILAAIEIQANIRRHLAVLEFRLKCCAVGKIQAFGRHALRVIRAERRQVLEKMSAIILQSFFRMASVRSAFLLERTAAVLIQRVARGFIVRIELEFEHFAATEIQRIWRGYDASANFAWIIISAIKIQSAMRVDLAKIQAERIRDEITASQHLRTRSVTKVQRAYRQYMHRVRLFNAAMIIQKSVRIFLSRLTFGRLRKAVCRVQSIVRGMLVRKHAHKKMKARLRSIRLANSVAAADPSLKLGNRTRAALDVLQTSSSLSEIMNTVCILEIATRLSEACCSAFASAGAPAILFSLIRTCNRSLPHIKLLHGILLVLSNVAQYEYLLPSLATTDGVEVFLDLVQMFRDKDFVFCLAVSLLERVVHFSDDFMVSFHVDGLIPLEVRRSPVSILQPLGCLQITGESEAPQRCSRTVCSQAFHLGVCCPAISSGELGRFTSFRFCTSRERQI
jgi:abnormal spindle-like microcephaly-associated protein